MSGYGTLGQTAEYTKLAFVNSGRAVEAHRRIRDTREEYLLRYLFLICAMGRYRMEYPDCVFVVENHSPRDAGSMHCT